MIKSEALLALTYYDYSPAEMSLEIEYEIKLLNDTHISIAYSGMSYVNGAAHPNHLFFTTNIDINSGKKLNLSDFTAIEDEFTEKLKTAAKNQLPLELYDSFLNYDDVKLLKYLRNSDNLHLGVENQYDTFSYLTEKNIGVSLPVGHAMGGYIIIEVDH